MVICDSGTTPNTCDFTSANIMDGNSKISFEENKILMEAVHRYIYASWKLIASKCSLDSQIGLHCILVGKYRTNNLDIAFYDLSLSFKTQVGQYFSAHFHRTTLISLWALISAAVFLHCSSDYPDCRSVLFKRV